VLKTLLTEMLKQVWLSPDGPPNAPMKAQTVTSAGNYPATTRGEREALLDPKNRKKEMAREIVR
jgi:hypothetical protein